MTTPPQEPTPPRPPHIVLVLITYALGGALVGFLVGIFGYGLCYLLFAIQRAFPSLLSGVFVPYFEDCVLTGLMGGLMFGFLARVIHHYWQAAKHPVRSAILWASLAGSLSLVMISLSAILSPKADQMVFLVAHLVGHIILGGLYGFLLATFLRFVKQ